MSFRQAIELLRLPARFPLQLALPRPAGASHRQVPLTKVVGFAHEYAVAIAPVERFSRRRTRTTSIAPHHRPFSVWIRQGRQSNLPIARLRAADRRAPPEKIGTKAPQSDGPTFRRPRHCPSLVGERIGRLPPRFVLSSMECWPTSCIVLKRCHSIRRLHNSQWNCRSGRFPRVKSASIGNVFCGTAECLIQPSACSPEREGNSLCELAGKVRFTGRIRFELRSRGVVGDREPLDLLLMPNSAFWR